MSAGPGGRCRGGATSGDGGGRGRYQMGTGTGSRQHPPQLPPGDPGSSSSPPSPGAQGMVYRPDFHGVVRRSATRSARHGVEETQPGAGAGGAGGWRFSPSALDRAHHRGSSRWEFLGGSEPLDGAGLSPPFGGGGAAEELDPGGKEAGKGGSQGAHPLTLLESKSPERPFSRPGESERDFRMRLADLGREARDEAGWTA